RKEGNFFRQKLSDEFLLCYLVLLRADNVSLGAFRRPFSGYGLPGVAVASSGDEKKMKEIIN
ncbi:hypothetical protein RUM43_008662, partial [Polyplax serrata]